MLTSVYKLPPNITAVFISIGLHSKITRSGGFWAGLLDPC